MYGHDLEQDRRYLKSVIEHYGEDYEVTSSDCVFGRAGELLRGIEDASYEKMREERDQLRKVIAEVYDVVGAFHIGEIPGGLDGLVRGTLWGPVLDIVRRADHDSRGAIEWYRKSSRCQTNWSRSLDSKNEK